MGGPLALLPADVALRGNLIELARQRPARDFGTGTLFRYWLTDQQKQKPRTMPGLLWRLG
jgi:hypothetical protein